MGAGPAQLEAKGYIMRKLIVLVACGGLLAGAAGCTKSSHLDEQTWCAKVAEVECRWIYSCCNLGERLDLTGLNAHEESEPTCREQLTATCLGEWAVPLSSIAASRMRFDTATANTCLDSMKTTASQCPTVIEKADECDHVVAGLVGPDGECAYDEECSGQARCHHVGAGAAGRCYDRAGQDGLCESSLDCQDGLFCYQGTMPQYVCVAVPTVGPNEMCNGSTLVCGQGYYCDSASDTCTAQKGSGESCTALTDCQEGLICDTSNHCGAGLGVGQTCSYYDSACAVGLYCDTSTSACVSRKGSGATCNSSPECEASLYCDNNDRCSSRHPGGETCTTGSDSCLAWYSCLPRGTCTARGDVGSECYGDDQCLQRLDCSPDTRLCEMQPIKLKAGAFCLESTECESSKCSSNECVEFCTGEF
jgi:hypothetical protein